MIKIIDIHYLNKYNKKKHHTINVMQVTHIEYSEIDLNLTVHFVSNDNILFELNNLKQLAEFADQLTLIVNSSATASFTEVRYCGDFTAGEITRLAAQFADDDNSSATASLTEMKALDSTIKLGTDDSSSAS